MPSSRLASNTCKLYELLVWSHDLLYRKLVIVLVIVLTNSAIQVRMGKNTQKKQQQTCKLKLKLQASNWVHQLRYFCEFIKRGEIHARIPPTYNYVCTLLHLWNSARVMYIVYLLGFYVLTTSEDRYRLVTEHTHVGFMVV